jgi:poly(A) polymerase
MGDGIEGLRRWLAPLGAELPEVYAVGGAVRDHLLGRASQDVDLMCADPEGLARRLKAVHDAAIVPFLKKPGAPCLRAVSRAAPGDFIDLVPMHGGSVSSDLGRRDFTINAMALRLLPGGVPGELLDPLDGRRDLAARIVRAAGERALLEDPLRVLRAARFAAELGFRIEPGTVALMAAAAGRLPGVAAERITRELFLTLQAPRSAPLVRLLDETGALQAVFPEIGPMKGCRQNAYHHRDVWGHTLEALERLEDLLSGLERNFGPAAAAVAAYLDAGRRRALLKLAVLLHDVGKPGSRAVAPADGRVTFYGHDALGGAAAEEAGRRLKLSAAEQEALALLVRHHMHLHALAAPGVAPRTIARWFRRHGEAMTALVLVFMADTDATRGPAHAASERERLLGWGREAVRSYYGELKARLERRPLIGGRDLAALGMAPGPAMGRVLAAVREAQDAGALASRAEALALARSLMH